MEALYIVINDESKFDDLLIVLEEKGYRGGTIFESQGMGYTLMSHSVEGQYGYLRNVFNKRGPFNKTLVMILNKESIETVKQIVRDVIGDLEQENTAFLFTVPVTSVEGLRK